MFLTLFLLLLSLQSIGSYEFETHSTKSTPCERYHDCKNIELSCDKNKVIFISKLASRIESSSCNRRIWEDVENWENLTLKCNGANQCSHRSDTWAIPGGNCYGDLTIEIIYICTMPGTVEEAMASSCNEQHIEFTCNGDSIIYINKHKSVVIMGHTRYEHCKHYSLNGGTLLNQHKEYLEGLLEKCNYQTCCRYKIVDGLDLADDYNCSRLHCYMRQDVAYFCFYSEESLSPEESTEYQTSTKEVTTVTSRTSSTYTPEGSSKITEEFTTIRRQYKKGSTINSNSKKVGYSEHISIVVGIAVAGAVIVAGLIACIIIFVVKRRNPGASSGNNNDPKPEAPVELNSAANTYNDASAARVQHVTDEPEGCVYSQVNLDNKNPVDSVLKPDVEELYENALGPQVPPKLYPNDLDHVDGEMQLIENDLYSE